MRIQKYQLSILLWVLLLSLFCELLAHGELHPQIEALSKQLKQQPHNMDLLLQRAGLWYKHGALDKALHDAKQVLQQNPNSGYALLLSAKAKQNDKNDVAAVQFVNRFIFLFPKKAQGYLLRASILQHRTAEKEKNNAISDYSTAISLLEHPRPELFLQRATLQLQQKKDDKEGGLVGIDVALQHLAQARKDNGFLYVLQKRAFDIANEAGHYADALTLAIDITEHMQRKEQWLKIQGELQHTMGHDEKAQKLYRAAQIALKYLPQRLQRHVDMISLKQELIILLKKQRINH